LKFNNGWVDTASEYNLMQNSMSREGYKPTHLVVHGTAGGTYGNDVIAYMGTADVSTHFVISVDGTIWQAVSADVSAWANAPLNAPHLNFDNANVNPNYWTLSIEFCKPDTTNVINITNDQLTSGIALVKLICETYGIPKKRGDGHSGIISHADINSIDRAMCPGTFPWDALITGINGTNQPTQGGTKVTTTIPNGWHDNGTTLTASNGIPVTDGFRTYILTHAWDGNNYPLEPARGLTPLELSNTALGGGTRLTCRWTVLEWTSKHGVFEAFAGQELFATLNILHTTQSQVTDRNKTITALNAEIEQLKAAPGGNTEQLQQQINALTAQVTSMINALAQINVLSKVS
jgi:N-acetyl-anhydromuramyl-L-alanine amidase AmpD